MDRKPWEQMTPAEKQEHRDDCKRATRAMEQSGDTLTSIYWRLLSETTRAD